MILGKYPNGEQCRVEQSLRGCCVMPGKKCPVPPQVKVISGVYFSTFLFLKVKELYSRGRTKEKSLTYSITATLDKGHSKATRNVRGSLDGTAHSDVRPRVTLSDQTLAPNNKFHKTSNSWAKLLLDWKQRPSHQHSSYFIQHNVWLCKTYAHLCWRQYDDPIQQSS